MPEVFVGIEFFFHHCVLVGENLLPVCRAHHVESHLGLEVGLVEAGKDSVGVVWLELGIDVLLSINIDEADASTAVIVVGVGVVYSDGVFAHMQQIDIK